MTLSGMNDLLPFLNYLDKLHIKYRIEHMRPDSLMVTYTLLGARVELDFFEDHIEYSVFTGDEFVLDDQKALFDAIEDFVRE
jgi:hypothetical protein